MLNLTRKLLFDEDGATAIEYGLIGALMAVAVIISMPVLKEALAENMEETTEKLDEAAAG